MRDRNSACSSFPKTAVNFHKMKKGLYLNSSAKRKDYVNFINKQKPFMHAYFSLRDYSDNEDMNKITSSSPFEGNKIATEPTDEIQSEVPRVKSSSIVQINKAR